MTSRAGTGTQICLTAEPNRLLMTTVCCLPRSNERHKGASAAAPTTGLLRRRLHFPRCSCDPQPQEERGTCARHFCAGQRSSEQGREPATCHPRHPGLSQQRSPTLAPTLPTQRPAGASKDDSGPLGSLLSAGTTCREITLKHRPNHVTPLLRNLFTALGIKS